ncbi:urea transporter [bacterium]|nr:urea transporter [bacterium]
MSAENSIINRGGSGLIAPLQVVLRGIGQIMFQSNAWTGLAFLAGIALTSLWLAAGLILGAVIGPLVAYLLKYERSEIWSGLHGYNPALVGIALPFYLQPQSVLTWGLMILACGLCVPFAKTARGLLKLPVYTAPFVIVTWLTLSMTHEFVGNSSDASPSVAVAKSESLVESTFAGLAEVMFGSTALTGLCFLAGLAVSDWRHAVMAFVGSAAGTGLSLYHHDPSAAIGLGIYGYNASLAALAIFLWRPGLLLPIFAALISVPLTEFFPKSLGIPALTAPFVIAAWGIILLSELEAKFIRSTEA